MAIKFNPLTGNFDFTGPGGGGGGGSAFFAGEVATYADLPLDGTAALNSRWLVRTNSGTWPFSSYKQSGIYIRTATVGSSRDNDYKLTDTSFHDVMSDDAFLIFDNTDPTKAAKFDVGAQVGANQTRVITVPNKNITLDDAGDSRTPTSHAHGNLTNDGKIGTTANLPLKTGTNGVIEAGAFGTAAGSFCEGNDARLSDDRDPNLHAASHLPDGADEIFDQSLNSSDSPTFAEVSIAGDETYALKTDATTYSGNNGFVIANGSSEIFSSTPSGEIIFAGSSAFLGIADRTDTTDRGLDKGVYGDSGCLKFWNNTTAQNTLVIADNGDVYIGPNGYNSLSYDGTNSSWDKNFLVAGNISARDNDSEHDVTFDVQSQLSADVTLTIPDQSGTLAVVDDLPTEVTDLAATGISADYVPVAQGDGTIVWEAQSGGGGGDTVSIQSTAADILSVSSGAISADDAGADRIVYWNNTSNKLTYGTPSDVGAAASSHTHSDATQSVAGFLSTTDKSKLDGIASGAEVNVNADWNASSGDAQILNKPTIGTAAAAATTDFAAASHTHAASAITSGTLDVARLPVGTGSTQVAAGSHTHVVADVTGAAASGSITSSGLTQATARILGRTSSSTGSIEEIQLGSGLSLSAGELSATGGGSGGTKTYAVFTAEHNQPPATAFATLDTRNSIAVLDFDAATDESAVFVGVIPEGASLGSGLKVFIHWMASTATSGNCRWGVQFEKSGTDLDTDSFDTATEAHSAANGTSGIETVTEITATAIDSLAAGNRFRLKVFRNADDATNDTMTGDAELIAVEIRSAA